MSILLKRVGTEQQEPERVDLRAGALSATLVAGNLRAICWRGYEALRAIAYVIRDKDWGTYVPQISGLTIDRRPDGFEVRYRAVCADSVTHQSLSYDAHLTGSSDGLLSFSVVATPETPFATQRCGFTILHPLAGVAGHEARIEHVDGSIEESTFPELIAPWQPFTDIRSITHEVTAGVSGTCRMQGDAFESEDQRNWSDASYKTYVRPLRLPRPYTMEAGVEDRQSVELGILVGNGSAPNTASSGPQPVKIAIGGQDGSFPAIGLSITPDQIASILDAPSLLREIRPQLLLFHLDPNAGHGSRELAGYAEIARQLQSDSPREISLELSLPCRSDVREELREIASQLTAAGFPLSSLMLAPNGDQASASLSEIYRAGREVFPNLRLGGGVLTYFTELNRQRPPVELLDYVSHCTCPIVHAADDRSVMQTLETLPYTVRSTRAFLGDHTRYRIGPSTIGMRHNPYGKLTLENPGRERKVMTKEDPRQQSLFAAAWMLGYAAATEEGRLDALTVGSLTGPLGMASASAAKYPVFHVAQGLAELGLRPRFSCRSSEPARILALAGTGGDGKKILWVANLTPQDQEVILPGGHIRSMATLDEHDTSGLRPLDAGKRQTLTLHPYASARIEPGS